MFDTEVQRSREKAILVGLEHEGVDKWELKESLEELAEVRKHRSIQRDGRRRHHWPVAALVGYTNAGKSTLLNRLTGAHVLAADQLFATLDPTTRQFMLPNNQKVLLTDTVGFIRKLPHTVIESFKATLEEVHEADLLIHVVDVSHANYQEQIQAVHTVIRELGADGKQMLTVFNKIDAVSNREMAEAQVRRTPNSVAISAETGEGVEEMLSKLEAQLAAWRLRATYRIPVREAALMAEIHRVGHVLELRYEEEEVIVRAHVPPQLRSKLSGFEAGENGAVGKEDVIFGGRRVAFQVFRPLQNMRNRAFTLIELLVVIAIIALLVSIAMPAYRVVMEKAHSTQDMNNLRQLGIGITAYLGDNSDTIFTAASTSGTSWAAQIGPGSAGNYVSDWHSFQSPFDSRLFSSTTPNVSYGMNTNILSLSATSSTATSFHYPSGLMVVGPLESGNGSQLVYPGTSTNETSNSNSVAPGGICGVFGNPGKKAVNLGMMNVLYEDAHVASVTANNFNSPSYSPSTGNNQSEFWQPLAQ